MYSPPPDTPVFPREYIYVSRKRIQACQEEGNTYVSAGREYRRVRRRGIHMCQKEGNTGVSGGGEYIWLTHVYSLPPDTHVFPSF
jgi:hypothetical protein